MTASYLRGGFLPGRHIWEDKRFPAGTYVCQSTGKHHPENQTIADRVAQDEDVENTDIVRYIQFGLTHFPRTEDFP